MMPVCLKFTVPGEPVGKGRPRIAKVKDALNGIAWKDDSQVVTEHIYKFYSDRPRLEVEIYKWEAGQ